MILSILGCLLGILLIVALSFVLSAYPGAFVIRKLFDHPVTIRDEKRYKEAEKEVALQLDLSYPSSKKDHTYDFYYPKHTTDPLPVVLWVHGGGYVGGDKKDVREFATYLAKEAHVAVLAYNYERAPESRYPGQLTQLSEWIHFLQTQLPKQQPKIDWNCIFIGGDSAGAQIAVQYASLQTNPTYAKQMDWTPDLKPSQLKGVLSYCGPLDLQQIAQSPQQKKSFFERFFIGSIARSLINNRNWQTSKELKEATSTLHLDNHFPPIFITDGNAVSFAEQGHAFMQAAKQHQVPVQSLFFQQTKKQIPHEYQFHYDTPEAKKCFEQTVHFIDTYTKKKAAST